MTTTIIKAGEPTIGQRFSGKIIVKAKLSELDKLPDFINKSVCTRIDPRKDFKLSIEFE
jgi:hypothetical protein